LLRGPLLLYTKKVFDVVVVPRKEGSVGFKVAVIFTSPLVEGRYAHVAVKEFAWFATILIHPDILFPFALKVTFPATEVVTLTSFD
jgi:hypothetical protein